MRMNQGRFGRRGIALGVATLLLGCGSESGSGSGSGGGGATTDVGGSDAGGDVTGVLDTAASDAIATDVGADTTAGDDADAAQADGSADTADAGGDAVDAADAVPTDDAGNPLFCGKPCAADEVCEAGVCTKVPVPCGGVCASGLYCDAAAGTCQSSSCTLPSAFENVQKVSYLQIAESSDGCDLNEDGKPDNVFGKLLKVYPAANTELQKSINDGLFLFLLAAQAWDYPLDGQVGKPFAVAAYLADFAPQSSGCSPTSPDADCAYTVDDDNFGAAASGLCPAQALVSPVTIGNTSGGVGQLTGGGDIGQKMTIVLPVVGGLDFTLSGVRLEATITGPGAWTGSSDGRICGVMTITDFDKALASIPADAWAEIGLDEATVKSVVKAFLNPDIDLNKDGVPDAMSVALRFKTVKGHITGVTF